MSDFMTQKRFFQVLNGGITSVKNFRSTIQTVTMDAFTHYEVSNDATRLSIIIERVKASKAANTAAFKQYIEAHTDLEYGKQKDGTPGFVKEEKGAPKVSYPDETWFEYKNQSTQPQPLPLDKRVVSLHKSLQKAKKEGGPGVAIEDKEALKTAMDEIYKELEA